MKRYAAALFKCADFIKFPCSLLQLVFTHYALTIEQLANQHLVLGNSLGMMRNTGLTARYLAVKPLLFFARTQLYIKATLIY